MCGRTCLTLEPQQIQCACSYIPKVLDAGKSGETKAATTTAVLKQETEIDAQKTAQEELMTQPEWRSEFNLGRQYVPSYNIAPTDITPVLVSADHFDDPADVKQTRVLVPMMWGMIPFWHKGEYQKHGLTTNNCRLEHMLESKLYRGPFQRGQRCVVLCEGFYEWQTTKSAKPSQRNAYLIYMPQPDAVKIYDKCTWKAENAKLLKMAGLFDIWQDDNGDKIFSYSVITFGSNKLLDWLHHRTPAVLETDEQVNDWLDFKNVSNKQALAALRAPHQLVWHQVSNLVNNSRHKSDQCNKPIDLVQKPVTTTQNKTLLAWLDYRKQREEVAAKLSDGSDEEESKLKDSTSESESEICSKRMKFEMAAKQAKQRDQQDNAGVK